MWSSGSWMALLVSLAAILVLPAILLVSQQDHDVSEHVDEVDEDLDGVPDVVVIAHARLLHDHLRVVQHETDREGQSSPEDDLVVDEENGEQENQRGRGEGASEVDELGGWSLEGGHREASEHNRGREEGRQNDRGVDSDDSLEERAHADSIEPAESEEVAEALLLVLAGVGRRDQSEHQPNAGQSQEEVGSEDVGEEVNHGSESGDSDSGSHRRVDILQMTQDRFLQIDIKSREGVLNVLEDVGLSLVSGTRTSEETVHFDRFVRF